MDLDRKKLLNLMNRMRSQAPPEAPEADCTDVSWTEPHHFDATAIERLTDIANALAGFMQRTMRGLCDDTFEVKLNTVTEHYASSLAEQVDTDHSNHYLLPLSMQGKAVVGFVDFPFETCTQLIAQMLRDPESGIGEEDTLSALEESILQDIVISITDSLLEGFSAYGEIILGKAEQIVHGLWPLPFQQLEDMFRMSFQTGNAETPLELSLCLLDSVVDSVAGVQTVQVSADQKQKMPEQIVECLADATTEASVWFDPSMMAFQDIVTLEKGDFVLLDHAVTTPVTVQINGQECFKAWPAQSAGCGAIVLTEPSTDS